MSTLTTDRIKQKLLCEELKAKRIKETREIEKQAASEVVASYKEYQSQLEQHKEKEHAFKKYKTISTEIEELVKIKADIIIAKEESEQIQERNKMLTRQKIEEENQKTNEFNMSSKQRVKSAAFALKNEKREKMNQIEEMHRFEAKKRVKEEEKEKSKIITQIYKDKEKEREAEEAMIETNPINVVYKITTPYHNNGNQIDYTTTRFHNILVERHEDDMTKLLNINAFEKAKKETQKTHQRVKSKEKAVQQFNTKTKENFKEIIRKNKAKENLEAFKENFEQLTRMKNKTPNKNRKINPNANVANAKEMAKKSEYMLNRKLAQQKGNRNNILNNGNNHPIMNTNDNDVADDESIRNFYKDDNNESNNAKEDDYLTNAIHEHNSNIDKGKWKYQYEEPIARDPQPLKEKIAKINAVDLESYQKAELADEIVIFHKEPVVSNKRHRQPQSALISEIESEVTEAKFSVLEALKISKKAIEDEEKERLNKKDMNKAVKDFYAKLNSSKISNKNTLSQIDEEKKEEWKEEDKERVNLHINKDRSKTDANANIASEIKNISKDTISSICKEGDTSRGNKTPMNQNETNAPITIPAPNKDKSKDKKKRAFVIANKDMEIEDQENEAKEEEYKRDETKWKYSKKELYERKKQLLKDKSNIKK